MTVPTSPQAVDKVLELPSGKTATIFKSKGFNIRQAQKLSGDDTSLYMNALMAQLVQIDGNFLVMEDYDQMDGTDYMAIRAAVSENFTPLVSKT